MTTRPDAMPAGSVSRPDANKTSDFRLPLFAVGTGAIAGCPQDSSLPTDQAAQVGLLGYALRRFADWCMRPWIDTALHYGAGTALTSLGLALGETLPPDLTLSIKVGRILECPTSATPYQPGPFRDENCLNRRFDYSATGIARAFEQSFLFLNKARAAHGWPLLDATDFNLVVFIHDPECGVHGKKTPEILAQVRAESLPALQSLKDAGFVKAIGIGTNEVATALALIDHPALDVAMVAGRLTLLCNGAENAPEQLRRDAEGLAQLLYLAELHGKSLVTAAPANSGVLYEGGRWYNYAEASEDVIAFRDRLAASAAAQQVVLSAAALQYPILAGSRAIVCGPASCKELDRSLADFHASVPRALWHDLCGKGLITTSLALDSAQLPPRPVHSVPISGTTPPPSAMPI